MKERASDMPDIIFITDKEIKRLNRKWFGRKRATDVITFGATGDPFSEIYISVDAAGRQARERNVPLWQEMLRLAVHGIAHAEGHDDTNLKGFCRMREREWRLLASAL